MNASQRILSLVTAATAITLFGFGGRAQAERLQVAADITSTFGTGEVTDYASPSVGGTASARFIATRWLALGVMGGVRRNTMAATNEDASNPKTQLTVTLAGLSARFSMADLTDGTHPFIGIDGGYARFGADHPNFAGQPENASTTGIFVTPQLGIETRVAHGLAFEVSFRYDYVLAKEALLIGDAQARDLSGAGLAAGFSFAL